MSQQGDVVLRDATRADIKALAGLWHAGWHEAHAAVVPADLTASRDLESFETRAGWHLDRTRVAIIDGELAGFTIIKDAELYQIYVAERAQGTGVAQSLLADAQTCLRDTGIAVAWLACAIGNERAARFYRKMGWTLAREEEVELETSGDPFPMTIWRFEKRLT